MSAGFASADLLAQAVSGFDLATSIDDFNHAAFQVVFEENVDGRRRAQLRQYVVLQGSGDRPTIVPSANYLDGDAVERERLAFYQWTPSMSSGDTGYVVKQDDIRRVDDGRGVGR